MLPVDLLLKKPFRTKVNNKMGTNPQDGRETTGNGKYVSKYKELYKCIADNITTNVLAYNNTHL